MGKKLDSLWDTYNIYSTYNTFNPYGKWAFKMRLWKD